MTPEFWQKKKKKNLQTEKHKEGILDLGFPYNSTVQESQLLGYRKSF